jgi:hypothetical protein
MREQFGKTGILSWAAAAWAILVVVNYVAFPAHLNHLGIALDALGYWARARPTSAGLASVLPGHLVAASGTLLLLVFSWLAGAAVTGWFGSGLRGFSLRTGVGMGLAALAMLAAGLTGLFDPHLFYPASAVLGAIFLVRILKVARAGGEPGSSPVLRSMAPGWVMAVCVALAVVAAALYLFGALAPETAYDSLIQHLADPRDYLSVRKIAYNDLSFLAQHPALLEMLYAWLLPAFGDSAAKLMHGAIGILAASAFREYLVPRTGPRDATLLACVLYLTPFLGILSTRAYVDNGLVFFAAAALASPWGSCLQGLFIGLAIGTKYLGGFLLIGWIAALVLGGRVPGSLRVLAAASLTAGWWGARNWLNTGNPVFPFGFTILGGLDWDPHSSAEYSAELASYAGVRGLAGWFAVPYLAVVRDLGALDDGSLGPLCLALVPFVLVFRAIKGSRVLGWLAIVSWALWLASPRQVRYALMLLPATYALLAAYLIDARAKFVGEFGERRAAPAPGAGRPAHTMLAARIRPAVRFVMGSVLPAILLVQLALSFAAIYLWVNPVYTVTGIMSRDDYLGRIMEPRDPKTGLSMYMDLGARITPSIPLGAVTYMLGDVKVYYLPGRWKVNALFNPPLLARMARECAEPDEMAKKLRQRGITHVLYNVGGSIHIEFTHHLFRFADRELVLLENFWDRWLKPAGRMDTTGGNEMYFLYELEAGRHGVPPYLPGLDTAIARVETMAIEGNRDGARREAGKLAEKYPSSRWLKTRMAEAARLNPTPRPR